MVAVRAALESLYTGLCDVIEYGPAKDPVTGIAKQQESTVHTALPCRVSFTQSPQVAQTGGPAAASQVIKLFTSPDVIIKSGSKIIVTQNGRTAEYASSGVPAVYTSHQEIIMELFTRWS